MFEGQPERTTSMTVSNIEVGDFFKVIRGTTMGIMQLLTGESYGDENEIIYFQKREKNFVIKENDFNLIDQS